MTSMFKRRANEAQILVDNFIHFMIKLEGDWIIMDIIYEQTPKIFFYAALVMVITLFHRWCWCDKRNYNVNVSIWGAMMTSKWDEWVLILIAW